MKKRMLGSFIAVVGLTLFMCTGCNITLGGPGGLVDELFGTQDYGVMLESKLEESREFFDFVTEQTDSEDESTTNTVTSHTGTTNTGSTHTQITVMDKDERIADFQATGYNYRNVSYEWQSYSSYLSWSWSVPLWEELYQYYSGLERYYQPGDYHNYINDEWNSYVCKTLAESIVKAAMDKGMSKRNAVFEVVAFVQSLPYISDLDENGEAYDYPKYPIETLMEGGGDCEDSTILLATMLKELGYGVAVIHYPGHILLGIAGSNEESGLYFTVDGTNYYIMETTYPGWKWGQLPERYEGEKAYVHVID